MILTLLTVDESRDGMIRLEVVPGAGGTGEAELVEIVRSDAGTSELPQ